MNYVPQVIKQDNKATFAVLPYEQYLALMTELEDLRDSLLIKQAQENNKGQARLSLDEILNKHQKV